MAEIPDRPAEDRLAQLEQEISRLQKLISDNQKNVEVKLSDSKREKKNPPPRPTPPPAKKRYEHKATPEYLRVLRGQ